MASNVSPAKPLDPADYGKGPESDGDPVRSRNGGQVVEPYIVCVGDADGPSTSAVPPSVGSTAPRGPCA